VSRYFIVSRPGWYGDSTIVLSSHSTIELAWKAIKRKSDMYLVRRGNMVRGDKFFRCYEDLYPVAKTL